MGSGDTESLGLEEHLTLKRRIWIAQRVGWGLMTAVVVAALAGAFGRGPLSRAQAAAGPLHVAYERVLRHRATGDVTLSVGPGAVRDGRVRLLVSGAWAEAVAIRRASPDPERVEATPDGPAYVFRVADASRPFQVRLELEPARSGVARGRLALADAGVAVDLRQLVLP